MKETVKITQDQYNKLNREGRKMYNYQIVESKKVNVFRPKKKI